MIAKFDSNYLNVYFSTNTSSEKITHIKDNNNIAIYYCIPEKYKGIMLQGEGEIMVHNNLLQTGVH